MIGEPLGKMSIAIVGRMATLPRSIFTRRRRSATSHVVAGMFMSIFEGQLGNA